MPNLNMNIEDALKQLEERRQRALADVEHEYARLKKDLALVAEVRPSLDAKVLDAKILGVVDGHIENWSGDMHFQLMSAGRLIGPSFTAPNTLYRPGHEPIPVRIVVMINPREIGT